MQCPILDLLQWILDGAWCYFTSKWFGMPKYNTMYDDYIYQYLFQGNFTIRCSTRNNQSKIHWRVLIVELSLLISLFHLKLSNFPINFFLYHWLLSKLIWKVEWSPKYWAHITKLLYSDYGDWQNRWNWIFKSGIFIFQCGIQKSFCTRSILKCNQGKKCNIGVKSLFAFAQNALWYPIIDLPR